MPYLSVATFCEKILTEADGGVSLIRMFDRYSLPAPSPQTPASPIPLNAAIILRSGIFRGPATLKIRPNSPSGQELPTLEFPIHFEGDDERGSAIMVNMGFAPPEQGLFWFDVILDDELITRIPLRVIFQRLGPVPVRPPQA